MYQNIILLSLMFLILFSGQAMTLSVKSAENVTVSEEEGSLNALLNSDFVRSSVWPGIGPFQSDSNGHLTDPSGNQLTYSVVGKKISSCQLEMRGGTNEAQCMLNLQMSVDFLLEGLGFKAPQIYAVNTEVNKNSKLLMGNNYNPIHATVAPFIVSLQNLGITEGTDNFIYRVVIANQNLTSGNLEINKGQENKPIEENNLSKANREEDKTIESAAASATIPVQKTEKLEQEQSIQKPIEIVSDSQAENKVVPIDSSGADNNKSKAVSVNDTGQSPLPKINADKEIVPAKALSKEEKLKQDFRDVIQNWQNLKKTAVRERDTKLLGQALSGKALTRQTDAIKWLINNHKYYEMVPSGAKIEKVNPILGNTKYAVFAEVREKTKFVEDSSGQVLKQTDDTYKVNYTIEKIGQKWLITDSTLIKSTAVKSSEKSALHAKNTVTNNKKSISDNALRPKANASH